MKLGYVGLLLSVCALSISACSSAPSSSTYTTNQAGTLQEVQYGTVVSVRPIVIREDSAETGKLAGGVIGGTLGSDVGEGKGQIVGGVAGAVLGGTVGMVMENAIQAKQGVEIMVRLQDGKTVALAQVSDEHFAPGEEVKVLTNQAGKARVTH